MFDFTSLVSYFVLVVIGWATYKTYIWPFYISPLRKIPGPPSDNPLFGNFKSLLTEEVNMITFLMSWISFYRFIYYTFFGIGTTT